MVCLLLVNDIISRGLHQEPGYQQAYIIDLFRTECIRLLPQEGLVASLFNAYVSVTIRGTTNQCHVIRPFLSKKTQYDLIFHGNHFITHRGTQWYDSKAWWRHQMETFSALLALCAGNSPVSGEFPAQRPVTRSFDVFFDLHLMSKHSWGWWFETLSRPLWRHCHGFRPTGT